jgi:hypothetical protein
MLTFLREVLGKALGFRPFIYILLIGGLVVGGIITISYLRYKADKVADKERHDRIEFINAVVSEALASRQIDVMAQELQALQMAIERERQERQRLTTDLLQLRTATEQQVTRIRNRQQTLERSLKDDPQTATRDLSEEYNELNRRLLKIIQQPEGVPIESETSVEDQL